MEGRIFSKGQLREHENGIIDLFTRGYTGTKYADFVFRIIFLDCTPYLLALGLTKSRTSLVWIAGPISGLIMQPIVGIISDRSKSRFGRRRPFMLVGSLVVALSLLSLGWAKDIASFFVEELELRKSVTIGIAILAIYAVDFAINGVQACCRALIVDTLPVSKQQLGNAWGSRMISGGHLIGYAIGTLDLVKILGPTIGENQFKQLTVISALALLFTTCVTSWAVTERVLEPDKDDENSISFIQIIEKVYTTAKDLPPRIQAICNIQLWSWIGWFPFHFYGTTYVGEIYFRYEVPQNTKLSSDALGDIGRIGSLALVLFSSVNLAGALILPQFIKTPDEEKFTHRPPDLIAGLVEKIDKYKPDLLSAWIYGQILFSCTMIFTPFAHSFQFAAFLVALCGLPWLLSIWAPVTFMGIEVNRISSRSSSIPLSSKLESGEIHNFSADKDYGEIKDFQRGDSGLYFGIFNIYTTIPQFIGTFISMVVFAVLEPGKSPELAQDSPASEHHKIDGPNAISVCLVIGAGSMVGAVFATQKLKKLYDV
ncbi:General alpha-glucoside permease [Golovinomyces cichoracearum]|uniref:General alpha-glucoside permease n=1 Tax=Golovinomyces cichoracearum TaxID=62708 RepID=A0A420ICD3_9PEZI|nr:General alpha-glucoside permease [Golovinomyces cichoracearum]